MEDVSLNGESTPLEVSRRAFLAGATVSAAVALSHVEAEPLNGYSCVVSINGVEHALQLESRATLLDVLREQLHLSGTKKGCDHGQCGACTVLVNGERVLSCLTLGVACEGAKITTIEGLSTGDQLHPMQAAFLHHDGLQCGFCTPGQICSAVAMLAEARRGAPSFVTADIASSSAMALTKAEVRERMSGNICRCGAYPNIVDAILDVAHERIA